MPDWHRVSQWGIDIWANQILRTASALWVDYCRMMSKKRGVHAKNRKYRWQLKIPTLCLIIFSKEKIIARDVHQARTFEAWEVIFCSSQWRPAPRWCLWVVLLARPSSAFLSTWEGSPGMQSCPGISLLYRIESWKRYYASIERTLFTDFLPPPSLLPPL